MSDRYSITNSGVTDRAASTTAAAGALLGLNNSTTTRRARLYDLVFGTSSTPADNALIYQLQRHTTHTSSTTITPTKLDPGAPAAIFEGIADITAVTLTSGELLLYFAANQRSTQRWVAAPGSELIMPALEDDGATFSAIHASATPNVEVTMLFDE